MKDKYKYYKSLFITYFDGCYGVDPEPNVPNTFRMGICKLEYIKERNTLVVHLRRPGLLIGRAGKTLNDFRKQIDCDIEIVEVNLCE